MDGIAQVELFVVISLWVQRIVCLHASSQAVAGLTKARRLLAMRALANGTASGVMAGALMGVFAWVPMWAGLVIPILMAVALIEPAMGGRLRDSLPDWIGGYVSLMLLAERLVSTTLVN